jgi:hypothetical protein
MTMFWHTEKISCYEFLVHFSIKAPHVFILTRQRWRSKYPKQVLDMNKVPVLPSISAKSVLQENTSRQETFIAGQRLVKSVIST